MLKNHVKVFNLAAVALVVVLIALQFVPFWSYEKTEKVDGVETTYETTASIAEYVWLPFNCRELTKDFGETLDIAKPKVNDFITEAALVLALGVTSVIMILIFKNEWMILFSLVVGVFGDLQFLTQKVMQMGSMWYIHLAVSVVLTAVSVLSLVLTIKKKFAKK